MHTHLSRHSRTGWRGCGPSATTCGKHAHKYVQMMTNEGSSAELFDTQCIIAQTMRQPARPALMQQGSGSIKWRRRRRSNSFLILLWLVRTIMMKCGSSSCHTYVTSGLGRPRDYRTRPPPHTFVIGSCARARARV